MRGKSRQDRGAEAKAEGWIQASSRKILPLHTKSKCSGDFRYQQRAQGSSRRSGEEKQVSLLLSEAKLNRTATREGRKICPDGFQTGAETQIK